MIKNNALIAATLLVSAVSTSQVLANQTTPFPMQPEFWNNQNQNGSMKDMYNYNAKAWNDWFGNGKTRYRFYGDIDMQMQLEMEARARANANAQNQAYQNWLNQQNYYNQYNNQHNQYYGQPHQAYPQNPQGNLNAYPR